MRFEVRGNSKVKLETQTQTQTQTNTIIWKQSYSGWNEGGANSLKKFLEFQREVTSGIFLLNFC